MCPVHTCIMKLENDPPYPRPGDLWGCHGSTILGLRTNRNLPVLCKKARNSDSLAHICDAWADTRQSLKKTKCSSLHYQVAKGQRSLQLFSNLASKLRLFVFKGWGFDSRHCNELENVAVPVLRIACSWQKDAERPSWQWISLKSEFQSWLLAHWSSVRCSSRGSLGEVRVTHPCPAKSNSTHGRPLESPLFESQKSVRWQSAGGIKNSVLFL